MKPSIKATEGHYGRIDTDRKQYRPLDTVTVTITGRAYGDDACTIRVCDDDMNKYCTVDVALADNTGTATFTVAGSLGVHWVFLHFPGEERHQRYENFLVDCETCVETGNDDYDALYPITREALQLSRREFTAEKGKFVGYISGDTWNLTGVWLRDWIYYFAAYVNWETEMTRGLDRFLEMQAENGEIPDGIRRDGTTWRAAVESDVEYILVLGIWYTWKATGDSAWMESALPPVEKALEYVHTDEMRWDDQHSLVKRGHTCDTWDFEIGETSQFEGKRFVVATCDQSGYYLAYLAMAEMYRSIGRDDEADEYKKRAESYRERARALLWDGTKFQHHYHLTPMEHPGFDESDQLSMGNVWAVTRGLASHEQAVSIISEYRRREEELDDVYPWWSLQPGYPDELGYYSGPYVQQGGYANGGLMPWVGGELCRGAFLHGMEEYGLHLLQQYREHLQKTGNRVHVWYWPDGQPGFRTTNEVPHTGWGMSEWVAALMEGLAGIRDTSVLMKNVEVAPRWAAAGENDVRVIQRYAANTSYVAYDMHIDREAKEIRLSLSGSGENAALKVLLPEGWQTVSVTIGGEAVAVTHEKVESSDYVCFPVPVQGLTEAVISCS